MKNQDPSNLHWLQCTRITKGVFSDERTITIALNNGEEESFWVPSDKVDESRKSILVETTKDRTDPWVKIPEAQPQWRGVPLDSLTRA